MSMENVIVNEDFLLFGYFVFHVLISEVVTAASCLILLIKLQLFTILLFHLYLFPLHHFKSLKQRYKHQTHEIRQIKEDLRLSE